MTKRNELAAMAMQALITAFATTHKDYPSDKDGIMEDYEVVAEHAYCFADAMLAEEQKQVKKEK